MWENQRLLVVEITMLRILANINIHGKKSALDPLVFDSVIPNGKLWQTGLKRKIPAVDSWVYESPYYRFHWETLDEELYDFLKEHYLLEARKINEKHGIEYALFTITPVEQSFKETFSCLLSNKMLLFLSRLGLSLEIAPAVIMPEKPFWTDHV